MITKQQLVRIINVMEAEELDFFLGAGASVNSGIPTGAALVWYFKKLMYCNEKRISLEKYKDLSLQSTRNLLQDFFDKKGNCPTRGDAAEYSYYFQECYPTQVARKKFIEQQVEGKNPSLGYLCLAELMLQNKVKNIWTTNFDSLAETALSILDPLKSVLTCSSANSKSIPNFNSKHPCIYKLHGDFRYDMLQNTSQELQSIESTMHEHWKHLMMGRGLVFVGYSGNDNSIMSFLEEHISEPDFLSKGLFWTIIKDGFVSPRVNDLIQKAKEKGKIAELVEIDGFDDFLYDIYKSAGIANDLIDKQWRLQSVPSKPLAIETQPIEEFIKLNAYPIMGSPVCRVFDTDISSWSQMRECIDTNQIIASLYNGCIYSFDYVGDLQRVFGAHIESEISEKEIESYILEKQDSIYIGMLYDLIDQHLIAKGFVNYARHKYYDPQNARTEGDLYVYEAIEIAIEYTSPEIYLYLLPTTHVMKTNGDRLSKQDYQLQINKRVSKVYNKAYNEKLRMWEKVLYRNGALIFTYKDIVIKFAAPAMSCGGRNRLAEWRELQAYTFEEPVMCFSDRDAQKCSINQLLGVVNYGPIDCSYIEKGTQRPPIKLAILSPKESLEDILKHLNKLNSWAPSRRDGFLPNYEGFSSVYRRDLIIPAESDVEYCKTYPITYFYTKPAAEFVNFLKRGIDKFALDAFCFDVLVIYIPKAYARFRESLEVSPDFNLHDAIKLYAMEKGVVVQFVEERSINSSDLCKVLWGLSTSIYAKSQGVLWHPASINEDTVYIGIGYAQSENNGICIGCSQLFDSTGMGVRMILRKIRNPRYAGRKQKNPYMDRSEARKMMTALREKYYHCCPTSRVKRVVIHKTTPFMKEEIIGITQAFEGVDVELIQIQEFSHWKGIRFGEFAQLEAESYALKRGTAILLNDNSFLLWTHGCVMNAELLGANRNYYKGGRGVPAPLLIKRFYGQSSVDVLAKEILMLTKMNWNSGDSLYKALPVTLDFAKILSRMSKQDEAIYDKAYDFRFFM